MKYKKFETEHLEKVNFNKSFTKDEFIRLWNGYEIWNDGTMIGMWDDKEFHQKNKDNKDWEYFMETFDEYSTLNSNKWGNEFWIDVIYNSFNDKERILNIYDRK